MAEVLGEMRVVFRQVEGQMEVRFCLPVTLISFIILAGNGPGYGTILSSSRSRDTDRGSSKYVFRMWTLSNQDGFEKGSSDALLELQCLPAYTGSSVI